MTVTKYDKYFMTDFIKLKTRNEPGPQRVFIKAEGEEVPGGVSLSIIGNYRTEPYEMVPDAMSHDFDQCLLFLGANPENAGDFDAEIELGMGEEREKHIITSPTVVHIPAGLVHGPLNFKKVNKPLLFLDISIVGKYSKISM